MPTRPVFVRWFVFNAVGLAGTTVQLSVLAALTRLFDVHVMMATVLAVEAAILHNFFWHQRWTWRDRRAAGATEAFERLARFHALNGTISLVGNVALTTVLTTTGLDPVVANVAAIIACSGFNFVAGEWLVFRSPAVLAVAAMTIGSAIPVAAQSPATLKGWDSYIAAVDRGHADSAASTFFALDTRKTARWRQRATAGEVPMTEVQPPAVSDGKMHHWAGAVYVSRISVADVVKRLQEYAGRESEFYAEVKASKLLERDGDRLRVFLKLQRDASVITVNYNTEHTVEYRRLGSNRAVSRSASTKIAELADAGTSAEREKAPGADHGFLWRLNAYWRFEQAGDGVLIECESVSLSRSVPFVVRPLVGPIANRIARESLERTLRSLRAFLARG